METENKKSEIIISVHELMRLIGYQNSAFDSGNIEIAKLISDIMYYTTFSDSSESDKQAREIIKEYKKEMGIGD